MLRTKDTGLFVNIFPVFLIFVIGTLLILVLGFFLLNWFSANVTTHSILGVDCILEDCNKINAGVMSLVIIFLIVFQYFFFIKYRRHKHKRLK